MQVLVDCGLFQGQKEWRVRNWQDTPVPAREIDAVILTHAHLDHCGWIPRLVKEGFKGTIYATPPTIDLCSVVLPDSGHLQEEEARYANKRGFSRHKPALPLYTEEDARACLKQLAPHAFGPRLKVAHGVFELDFRPAGHILGASIAMLQAEGVRIVFSGDLGRMNDPVMRPPQPVSEADYVVVESTYGNRRHEQSDPEQTLGAHLKRALERGGVVVVPAFAVGRAQTLLYFISRLKARRAIPDVPVFLNSPMALNATRLYHEHRAEHRLSPAECEAMCNAAKVINSADESRALNQRSGPMVIISASGMATGGRVVHHLKAFAPDPRNMIVLAGFQAAGTRGAALASGAEAIKIHGEYVPVRAEVVKMDNLSAHADYVEILDWLRGFKRPPKRTFVTHGEPAAADELRRRIEEALGWTVIVPEYGEKVELR